MKLSIIFLTFTLTGQVFAEKPKLGQDSDPVGGDSSRCCRTGVCTGLKLCQDTQLGAERGNLKDSASVLKPKGRKGTVSAQ